MNRSRHTTRRGALLAAGALALAACGTAATDDGQPVGRPPATVPDHVAAWQAYYDMTHPPMRTDAPPGPAERWQVYYDLTHPNLTP